MNSGLIDLHCHILPGIDDGCVTLEDSLGCIRRLKEHGFAGAVCTPHFYWNVYPDITPAFIERQVEWLRQQLADAGIAYHLWAGAEVRITEDTINWFEEHGVPTLGNSRWVLLDYWGEMWPGFAFGVVEYLLAKDFQPILAHPERMNFADDHLDAVLDSLLSMGVRLQGNLNSVAGAEGEHALRRMQAILGNEQYFVFATDTHRPSDLDNRMNGLQSLHDRLGNTAVIQMLGDRPRQIVG